ncbi:MAG: GNAT family N-acetyltransferase [Desulfamplus sp.]|nr:GNAT family N-acetyltransferase [Desulfamplus sp.]
MPPKIRVVKDIDECAFLWQKYYPVESLFDIWWVRETFAKNYMRDIFFIVHEENGRLNGLLPLCKVVEPINAFAFFPGEIWHNRTWMEQNKIIAENSDVMREMLLTLCSFQNSADIRYLCKTSLDNIPSEFSLNSTVDETGYLFYPKNHEYSYEKYLGTFAGKSRKKILSEITAIEKQGISFRYNDPDDLDTMFRLNISNFGEHGYFHDPKFLQSFIELASNLDKNGMLRVVTVLINGEIAAVDMGAIWNNTCIMLAGGTNKKFLGIAKLINLHHLKWACSEKIEYIDFLCGDFGWKERFHLTPRTLYQIILKQPLSI